VTFLKKIKQIHFYFLPCDTNANTVYSMALCLSVTTRSHAKIANRLSWFLAWKLPMSNIVLKGNLSISKNKGISLWNFVPNAGLRKFHHSKFMVLSTKLVDQSQQRLDAYSLISVSRQKALTL